MIKQWLSWIAWGIGGVAALLVVAALLFILMRPEEVVLANPAASKRKIPTGAFTMPQQSYDAIGKAICDLKFSPLTMQVPDLRHHLVYYGKNGRPDSQTDHPVLHFGFSGNPNIASLVTGERLYLLFDKKKSPAQYVCSSQNTPTPLWIEATPQGNEAHIKVSLQNENGEVIREPSTHAQLTLPEKDGPRTGLKNWEIGKWRVDGGLLARQKARWMGLDLFLERHGGEEYQSVQGKHRIDFTDEDNTYSVFVGLNDSLVWQDGKWSSIKPGSDTLKLPLMVVKKIDERVMTFELWDIGGKNKIVLNLIKMHEAWMPRNVQESFHFLGARTRSQYIFEIDEERMLISPQDWLLQTDEGWIKLTDAKEIDDFVERKVTGVLFVFDGVARQEGRQMLKGVMFNASRTEMQEVEIAVQKGAAAPYKASDEEIKAVAKRIDTDDDDDDEDDDSSDEDISTRPSTTVKK